MSPVALFPPDRMLAIAHGALLSLLDRDDPAHSVAALLSDLGQACGRRAWLDGAPCSQASHADDGTLTLPLGRLGTALGRLCLHPGADLLAVPTASALQVVTDTLAALMQRSQTHLQALAVPEVATGGALVRAALHGAGTMVWEWHIASDRLSDIDEGFAQLGYPPAAGRRTQQDWDTLIHPDDLTANHQAYLRHAAGEADDYEHVYRARAADGSWRWLHERGRIVDWVADGSPLRMVGVQADITGRLQAESAAAAATQRLGKIAAHVPGALFQFQRADDGFGRFPYISERSVALFGVRPDELAADASRLLRRVDLAHRAAVMASIDASGVSLQPWVQEFQVHRPDGAVRWIRGSATPQREPDGQVLWHGYFEDLTEWQALARADHRQRVAEAANLAKNEFLSGMSHELRTPLNAVLGFAQLMALDAAAPLADVQQRRLALICQSGEHLLAMIDDLLDLTSIEAGRLPLAPQAIDLRPLADDALAMVQAAAVRHDLALACEGGGLQAWADRTRLRQVLINLLSNAVKYNRPGGGVLVRVLEADGQAVLEVHDTGLGLTEAECAQLFEPFNRLGQAQGPVEGTGIGLTITHHLVRLMGGHITVQSTPGTGSCFAVHLPMPGAAGLVVQGTSLP